MTVRGIRGATTVEADAAEAILGATEELVREMVEADMQLPHPAQPPTLPARALADPAPA